MICAPSEDSDQPGHPPSLIRVITVHSIAKCFFMWTAKSEQTGQKPRLICVFSGRTGHFVDFCHAAAHLFTSPRSMPLSMTTILRL